MNRFFIALLCGSVALFLVSCNKEKDIAVTSVFITQATAEMYIGESVQLTASVLPSDATDKSIIWTSSKQSVATVSSTGKVTAVDEGVSTITASAGGKSSTCIVTVSKRVVAVISVTLNKTALELTEGDSETLVATVAPEDATDKTITWSSSDATIATVVDGKVTAMKEGKATITAKAGEKATTCTVTVAAKIIDVESIELDKISLELTEGDTDTIIATVKPDNATDKSVIWSSSNDAIATVADGKVTAVKEGKATITAKAGDKTATCRVTVSKNVIHVASVTLDMPTLALTKGEETTLTATVKPDDATDKTVTWSSSDTQVATVENGKVKAVGGGSANITAKAGDKSTTCSVTVTVPVASVTLDMTTLDMTKGDEAQLTASVKPDDATGKTVTWSTSNAEVATVENGKVKAVGGGSATITAKAGDKTATCSVTVTVPVVSVTLDMPTLDMTEGDEAQLTATVKPDDASDKTITWSSDKTDIVTVDDTGKVKAVMEGTATITAKAGDKTATCSVIIKHNIAYDAIVFSDPAAKYACVAKFDTNNDGEVSIGEAEAATSFDGLFDDWKGVASFDEISYFKNVHSISGVFRECNKLVSISIPENITDLGKNAFYKCSALQSVSLPSGITAINDYTFYYCTSLSSINIPSGVTLIGDYAFDSCVSLESIVIPTNVMIIGKRSFEGCSSIKEITVPESVWNLGEGAFLDCTSLSTVVFRGSLSSLPKNCFYDCKLLRNIVFPDGLTTIGEGAFKRVNSWSIELPPSVTKIGADCFTNIKNILLTSTTYVSIEQTSFYNAIIYVPVDMMDAYRMRTNWATYLWHIYPLDAYKDKSYYSFETRGAVDMGLSVKWAAFNVGATKPEEFGEYYAWGETDSKSRYVWDNYFDNPSGDGTNFTKYYSGDGGETTLEKEEDVASVKWGGDWRIPSSAEVEELMYGCIWEEVEYNGAIGSMVYGINSGKCVFFPKAGYYEKDSRLDSRYTMFWSSSLCPGDSSMADVGLTYWGNNAIGSGAMLRSSGLTVRPVYNK